MGPAGVYGDCDAAAVGVVGREFGEAEWVVSHHAVAERAWIGGAAADLESGYPELAECLECGLAVCGGDSAADEADY